MDGPVTNGLRRWVLKSVCLPGLLSAVVLSGCGGSTEPSIAVQFIAVPSLGGSFTLNLQGTTYTSSSLQTVTLSPGTYEVSGTATGTVAQGRS